MKLPVCLFVLLFSVFGYAQQTKIDSLTILFNETKADTTKAEILAKIGIAAYFVDFKKAKFFNDSLISFSKGKSKKHEALGYRMQGTLQLIDGDYSNAQQSYMQSLNIFEDIGDKGYQGALIANLATLYARQNQIDKADSLYLAAIDILKDVKADNQSINCYVNLGINALNANKLKKATEYFIQTLKVSEEKNNKRYQFYAYNQLGVVYLKRQLYDKAENNLLKAITLGNDLGDKTGLSNTYNSLGALHDELEDHQKSLQYFIMSKEAAEDVNDKDQLPKAYINAGHQYEILGDITNAISNFKKAIALTTSVNDSSKVVTANLNLAALLLKQNNVELANQSLNDAEVFMPIHPDDDYHKQYQKISNQYARLGMDAEAYHFLKKYSVIIDSLYIKNDMTKVAAVEAKYQTEKKEKENLQLRAEKVEQELKIANANTQKWIFPMGLLGTIIALGTFIFYYRRTKKQKDTIEELQKELHHRVKNNLSIIDTFIEVAKDEFDDKKFSSKLSEIQNRIDSINAVHLQLYQSKDSTNLNLKNYISKLIKNVETTFNNREVVISKHIPEQIKLNPNKSFPIGLVINEFLTNSFKYAFKEGSGNISIVFEERNSRLRLQLQDNGKGLPRDFDIDSIETFGLRIVKLLTQQLDGSFDLKNDNGVSLTLEFPK